MNRSTKEFDFRLFILLQHVFLAFYVFFKKEEEENSFSVQLYGISAIVDNLGRKK